VICCNLYEEYAALMYGHWFVSFGQLGWTSHKSQCP